ncbi:MULTISPECIES: polyhydroxyalkanoate depolymerase [Rhodanobacter]|uniref:polyhydroxyalkanoate depolymerase n=1 Tax=Rhodanobacter TaxID=75309 RepID=UPI000412F9E0|nr:MULTISPECIES: polyhydroxyalkanoate depolymerase [Rhodanobacter]TAN16098.1 MAG: polyhydroxyalkanoate depolymerase [Rhodanobacter sp.]UJJ55797.1 polyhydroxyalkanoate depolymerase [Rhodanobacter thiooxydans]
MLYQIHEWQRAFLGPLSHFAQAGARMLNDASNPFAQLPGAQRMAAGYELMHRIGKAYEKPAFGIHTAIAHEHEIAVIERVALDQPFCQLKRFKRFSDDPSTIEKMKNDPVVLVVAPLSGHHATLLRDTVRTLLRDHKVYITDWVDARMVPAAVGPFGLDDYIAYVRAFIRHIGASSLHVISVCQPTVPVLAAVSLMAARGEAAPRSLTMMGGPIDPRRNPTSVNNLATTQPLSWFKGNVIHTVPPNYPGHGREVYPGFLQHAGFIAMNPGRHLNSHWDFYQDLVRGDLDDAESHRKFYDEYNAVLDMPAEFYLDTIEKVFQQFLLPRGRWDVAGERVNPAAITRSALLTIEGELDDISGLGQTEAAHDLCSSIPATRRAHKVIEGAGHYGIFSGRRWRETVYPQVRDFIRKFDHAAK